MAEPTSDNGPGTGEHPAVGAGPPIRTIGLGRATGVGLGAIVGGGILVLAGTAFRATGPGAVIAFALNGGIAFLTALTFAELATTFPESGGSYTYAKKVFSLRVAFVVGWVLWFAYLIAGVLYALGFAEYAVALLGELWRVVVGPPPRWLVGRSTVRLLAVLATAAFAVSLIRKAAGGRQWFTIGKVVLFVVLIVGGLVVLARRPPGTGGGELLPLLPRGTLGLVEAMGFTFIALQGFEIIAAAAGEVREPRRTLPRAMFLSLGAALAIYLPFLVIVATVGVAPGHSILTLSQRDPETVVALAARQYLGPAGYWLVVVAAILATLSALQANVLAASRVALSMARDGTLPPVLAELHRTRGTPVMALYASALAMVGFTLMIPNLSAAGAAASLIFLASFALTHATGFLARRRAGPHAAPFRVPWFPAVPVLGGAACAAVAVFQGFAVPGAGAIVMVWLAFGVILFVALFARRAQARDAFAEAVDPRIVRYRGRSPLVLVPVANPASAAPLVAVARALAPPEVGRVLLLSVMREVQPGGGAAAISSTVTLAQEALREAFASALAAGHSPEALMTVAPAPLAEIARVARTHHCESLLLGLHRLDDEVPGDGGNGMPLEDLLNDVECDVAILKSHPGWSPDATRRILVPLGGKGEQDELRARLLGSLCRSAPRHITFLQVLPAASTDAECDTARRAVDRLAIHESPSSSTVVTVVRDDDVVTAVTAQAATSDLVVLGLPRLDGRKLLGELAGLIATRVSCPVILISRRG